MEHLARAESLRHPPGTEPLVPLGGTNPVGLGIRFVPGLQMNRSKPTIRVMIKVAIPSRPKMERSIGSPWDRGSRALDSDGDDASGERPTNERNTNARFAPAKARVRKMFGCLVVSESIPGGSP